MNARIQQGLARVVAVTGRPAEQWRPVVLAEADPGHLVVEYRHEREPKSVVAKFYRDGRGRAAFETMRAIGRATTASIRVPAALDFDDESLILLQERACGRPFTTLAEAELDCDRMRRVGAALAELHRLPVADCRAATMDEHLRTLVRPHPLELAQAVPAARATIEATLAGLRADERTWGGSLPVVPIHRDFQLRQLFDDPPHIWVVDWDLLAYGDPAFDLAYLLVYLETHLPAGIAEPAGRSVLAGYGADPADPLHRRIPTYRRFNYLRRACRRFRLGDRGWRPRMREMLERLESSL